MEATTDKCPFCHKQFTSKDNVPIQVNYGTEEVIDSRVIST